jgi:hypothetical protein
LAVSLGDYELTLTVYFDYLRAMATMRSKYVPEEARATIMNYFRIPLNLIVVVILLKVKLMFVFLNRNSYLLVFRIFI